MSKKKGLAGLDSLKAIGEAKANPTTKKKITIAGKDSAEKALAQTQAKKQKPLALRLAIKDHERLESLALKLKQHGLQYSEANAVRLALRLFKGSDKDIAKIAEEIKAEDGRRQRGKAGRK